MLCIVIRLVSGCMLFVCRLVVMWLRRFGGVVLFFLCESIVISIL